MQTVPTDPNFMHIDWNMRLDRLPAVVFLHPTKCGGKSIEQALFDRRPSNGSSDHSTAQEWIKRGPTYFDTMFVFGWVRNPWDRLVSDFFWNKRVWEGQGKKVLDTFEDIMGRWDIPKTIQPRTRQTQKSYFVNSDGVMVTNFVGKLENMQDDWKTLCEMIEIEHKPLPHTNTSKHEPYWTYYNDETRSIVAEAYKEDIDEFNHEFGAPT
jgi:hypothetical protein